MTDPRVIVKDENDGCILATFEKTIKGLYNEEITIYKFVEYYHSEKDILRDILGIEEEE